ncbi:O-antigen/teichoic acid export membrane protein [Methylobacter tundripaludum]|uniref:O-antigen/teichoic acid export membrane protein n=1 Tax=Methylobacter tundripaludum TaxID=173365 RepID=A0A2S6H8B3_9GAMM|nr:polysaccharide biosynthesis C-terminal domain-containing protein [Methylobacter tundripaludum]PPK73729.1 O-antigen/teichoic acid export membrane protein [Methylobacter tundripaludum]
MLLIAIGRIAQFALLLLTLRLATSLLSPAEMGKISIVTATVAFFALLLLNPVGMFMNRRLHAWDLRGQATNYLMYFWRYLLIVNVFSALVLFALTGFNIWSPSINIYWLLLLVCGNLIFGTINQVVIPGLNLLGHRGWFSVLAVATTATSLIFAVVLVREVSPNAENWLSGLLIGQLIVGLIGKRIFFGKLQRANPKSNRLPKLSHSHIQSFLGFAWPVAIAVGLGWIQSQGYRYLMEERLGLIELGLFVAGYGISAGLIAGFESIFTTYFQPKFYKRISNDNINEQYHAWIEYSQSILPSLLLTSILIMATAPELTQLLLGSDFKLSTQFVVWGALAELARISTAVFGMAAHARMNTKLLLLPNLVGAAMSILLIWYLTPVYGSHGIGFGLAFSSMVTLLLTIYITKNHLSVVLPLKLFVKSAIMGAVLFVMAKILSQLLDYDGSHLFAFIRLCVIGLLFLLFQYSMLLPVLRREAVISHN